MNNITLVGEGVMRFFKEVAIVGLVVVGGVTVVSCAKAPETIQASYVSPVSYQYWTCEQLGQEQLRLSSALAVASKQQKQARTNDTVGILLVGLPVSSMSGGNVAPQIARLKGEQGAVRNASRIKNCAATGPATINPSE